MGCELGRPRELFAYLLLNRHRVHAREVVASQLWGDHYTTSDSRKQLRKALWQLQAALHPEPSLDFRGVLCVENDWIRVDPAGLWLDVAEFEEAYAPVQGVPGARLDEAQVQRLTRAVGLYKEDLLDGLVQDWCLCERERFRHLYLVMMDKLAAYHEARQAYEPAIRYARQILVVDRAREHTHRQLMRLYYLTGNPGGAVDQFEQCVAVLRAELEVGPAHGTVRLMEQIRAGLPVPAEPLRAPAAGAGREAGGNAVVARLRDLQAQMGAVERQLQHLIAGDDRDERGRA